MFGLKNKKIVSIMSMHSYLRAWKSESEDSLLVHVALMFVAYIPVIVVVIWGQEHRLNWHQTNWISRGSNLQPFTDNWFNNKARTPPKGRLG